MKLLENNDFQNPADYLPVFRKGSYPGWMVLDRLQGTFNWKNIVVKAAATEQYALDDVNKKQEGYRKSGFDVCGPYFLIRNINGVLEIMVTESDQMKNLDVFL